LEKVRAQEFNLLPLTRHVVERAGGVIEQCHPKVPLRTLDAIHVATAELQGGEEMCSSDARVCDASELIGLALAPRPRR
jgi:predicted nucleic acid-binding protein